MDHAWAEVEVVGDRAERWAHFFVLVAGLAGGGGGGRDLAVHVGTASGTSSYTTASGTSTSFLPAPTNSGGTAFVRVGTGGGGHFLHNDGDSAVGSGVELQIRGPTGTSINKASIYNITGGNTAFYVKFTMKLTARATSGNWYFFAGDGATFADGSTFSGAQTFLGLQLQYGAGSAITENYRNGSSWSSLNAFQDFSKDVVYQVEVYGNNSSGSVNYQRGGNQSLAAYKWDLWVDGTLVGNDLAKAGLANGSNIDSFMFYGESFASNNGTNILDDFEYGNALPSIAAATVSTAAGTATNTSTATVGGDVTSAGGGTVTNRGVCYKTSAGVAIGDNKTASGSGTGAFTVDLTSLAVNTRHYYRAYADNEAGSALGGELEFWTWANVPSAPTVANPSSSSLDVTVNANGNPAATLFAIACTNTAQFVQTNGTLGAVAHWRSEADWGTVTVIGLSPSQEYGFRVTARNGAEVDTAVGAVANGTTGAGVTPATVSTAAGTATNTSTATVGGDVTSAGGGTVTNRGVCYKTSAGVAIGDNKTASGSGTGAFTVDLTSLAVNTRHYYRAYADNEAGSALGGELEFWTWANVPSAPTVANPSSSSLDVTVNANGNPAATLFAIACTNTAQFVQTNGTLGAVAHWRTEADWGVATVGGLSPGVEYAFRVQAVNGADVATAQGGEGKATTLSVAPSVSTTVATATNATTAVAGGHVSADGGAAVTNRGVVWGAASGPAVPGAQTTNGTGTGSFTATLTNLTPGASYHYRAFAQNSVGTAYGAEETLQAACWSASVTGLHASATNQFDFTAAWSAVDGATGYALDVSTNPTFGAAGGTAWTGDFEGSSKGSYASNTVTLNGLVWYLHDALIGTGASDRKNGASSARAQNSGVVGLQQATNMGLSAVKFVYAKYGSDGNSDGRVEYSLDGAATWSTVGTFTASSTVLTTFEATNLAASGSVLVRILKTSGGGARYNLDDLQLFPHGGSGGADYVAGYSNRAVAGTSDAVTGLASSVTYHFRVRATNETCVTPDAAAAAVTTRAAPAPEIAVLGTNGAVITDGAVTPSLVLGTDFGQADLSTGWVDRVFVVTNLGSADLTIAGVTTSGVHAAEFTVTAAPAGVVAAGAATSFTVRFDPSAFGGRTATVVVASDDADEAGYDFVVRGEATIAIGPAVEQPALTWSSDGSNSVAWFGQPDVTHDGVDAAQSGRIGHNGATWLHADVTGPGTVTFWWRASSELDYDTLDFFIGPTFITNLSGDTGWLQYTAAVPAGVQELYWQYVKDGSITGGQDAAWVDEIVFTPGSSATWSDFSINGAGNTNLTDVQLGSAITLRVTYADSDGVNWNGATLTPPALSPFLVISNPAGAEIVAPVAFASAGHTDGEFTSVMTGVVTVTGISTGSGFRAHLAAADQNGNLTNATYLFTVTDDDAAPPTPLEFTLDGVGGTGDTNLITGGIAIVAVNGNPSNGYERFSFVVLAPFPAGTIIDFTDCGWNPATTNWHRPNEFHTNRYVSSGDADVGQVFSLVITNLNNQGDQIAAYQYRGANSAASDATNTFFLSAINLDKEADGWDSPPIPDDNEHSGLYFGLTNGWSAMSIPNAGANARYTGTVVGTASALLQSIMNADNWLVEGSPRDVAISNYAFTVTGRGTLTWTAVEMTDAQVREGGYRVTNIVQDAGSGLSTSPPPHFLLVNNQAGVIVSNTFATSFSPGDTGVVTLEATAGAGAYGEIALGVATAIVIVADADADWAGDSALGRLALPIHVSDDDGAGPVFSNVAFQAGGISGLGQSGELLFYSFGSAAPASLQPDTAAAALAVADITANGDVPDSASGASGQAVSYNGWNGATNFWQLALTIQPGLTLQITGVQFSTRCSATGPTNWTLRSSADGYGSDLALGGLNTNSTFEAVTASVVSVAASNTLNLRLYGAGAASGAGTWRLDNLSVRGVIAVDPAAYLVSDADLLTNGWSFAVSVHDAVSGVMSNGGPAGPRYALAGPGGALALAATNFLTGPATNGDARAAAVVCTGRPAVAFADIALGTHTARLTAVDFDDDRVNDGATGTATLVFTVLDDDTAAPVYSTARGTYLFFDGKGGGSSTEVTDGDLTNGLAISNRLYDTRSGLLSTSLVFQIRDPLGWNSGWQLFTTRPADGAGLTNSFLNGGLVAHPGYEVDITNRVLGTWTVAVAALDFDLDRPNDGAGVTQSFAVTVIDDDRYGPRMTNLTLGAAGAVLFATSFDALDGWGSLSGSDWTNVTTEGVWISTGAYVNAFDSRGGVGFKLGFNDINDRVQLPAFTNGGWVVAWARLSTAGSSTFALQRHDGVNWTNAGVRTLTNLEYQVVSWELAAPETNAAYRLQLQGGTPSVYVDDLSVLAWPDWTNRTEWSVGWDAANDGPTGGSGIHQYRWLDFGAAAPVQAGTGQVVSGLATLAVAVVEGAVTGHVFAIDDDADRGPQDRLMGPSLPVVARIDLTPPPLVTGCAVHTNVADDETELGVNWTGYCTNAGDRADGVLLSPWSTYVVFYTADGSDPDTNSAAVSAHGGGPADLATNTTTSVIVSNLTFDTEYRFRVAGRDRAGNLGPLSATVTGLTELFVVTQGLVRASNQVELAWTRSNTGAVYDVIWQDGAGWRDDLTNSWRWMSTVTNSWGMDGGATNRVDPYALGTNLRFYRVSREGRWLTNQTPRRASREIHVANAWTLRAGENWLSLLATPEDGTVAGIFGTNRLPAAGSPALATRVSWFEGGSSDGAPTPHGLSEQQQQPLGLLAGRQWGGRSLDGAGGPVASWWNCRRARRRRAWWAWASCRPRR